MKFLLILSALLAVAAARGVDKKESKLFFTMPKPAVTTAKPAPTTAKPTTTTTTTAKPTAAPENSAAKMAKAVDDLCKLIPQLEQMRSQIFRAPTAAETEIFKKTPEQLPTDLQAILKAIVAHVNAQKDAGKPVDLAAEVELDLTV